MQLEISDRAQTDIDLIFLYGLDNFGRAQANLYMKALFDLFDLLPINPRMGIQRLEFKRNMRSIAFKSHVIFYRIGRGRIYIVRVLHGRQNWIDHL